MNTVRQQNLLGHTGGSLACVREKLTIITKVKRVLAHLPKLMLTKCTLIDFMEMDDLWSLSLKRSTKMVSKYLEKFQTEIVKVFVIQAES